MPSIDQHLPHDHYRDLLKSEFNHRQSKNKNYSLRSFARDLTLDPGHLSMVMSQKKNLSLNRAMLIAKKLFDNPSKSQAFYHSVELSLASNDESRKSLEHKIDLLMKEDFERDHNIEHDEFETISTWYHIPVLESLDPNFFSKTINDVATYFGITPSEAREAIKRLERLGFVEGKNKFFRKIKSIVTTTNIPNFAIRHFHSQMIDKGRKALLVQPLKMRHNSAVTIKISKNKIDEYKKAIEEFEKKIIQLSDAFTDEPNQEVYQINTQLFCLKKDNYDQ